MGTVPCSRRRAGQYKTNVPFQHTDEWKGEWGMDWTRRYREGGDSKIHKYYPRWEVWRVCIMPDHIHLIVRVKEGLERGGQAMESGGGNSRGTGFGFDQRS